MDVGSRSLRLQRTGGRLEGVMSVSIEDCKNKLTGVRGYVLTELLSLGGHLHHQVQYIGMGSIIGYDRVLFIIFFRLVWKM